MKSLTHPFAHKNNNEERHGKCADQCLGGGEEACKRFDGNEIPVAERGEGDNAVIETASKITQVLRQRPGGI